MAGEQIQHKNEVIALNPEFFPAPYYRRNSISHPDSKVNAAIYIDYETICELLRKYGVDPLEINFFPVILERFKDQYELDIAECIAYANFEKKPFQGRHQMILHTLGVQTRHTANQGKNCGDMMLTVDSMNTLYKKPAIEVFIIVSSDRDMIPLINALKSENKITFMLSTKYGFNSAVSRYADFHEYIEDLFNLTPDMLQKGGEGDQEIHIRVDSHNSGDLENAREVAKMLYSSNVWRIYEINGNPITLKGYVKIIAPKIGRNTAQLIKDFELAHHYKYITIYKDDIKGFCLKKGENYLEILQPMNSAEKG